MQVGVVDGEEMEEGFKDKEAAVVVEGDESIGHF